MTDLLIRILDRRYACLMNEYMSLEHGDPEQGRVAIEMDDVDFELFQLRTAGFEGPTRDSNWGDSALALTPAEERLLAARFRQPAGLAS